MLEKNLSYNPLSLGRGCAENHLLA